MVCVFIWSDQVIEVARIKFEPNSLHQSTQSDDYVKTAKITMLTHVFLWDPTHGEAIHEYAISDRLDC